MDYAGILIREKRLEKNWSQEGLCKGICAVSYLSKIEQGKTEASEEVLAALFKKLGIDWVTDEKILSEGKNYIADWYDSAFSGDYKKTSACFERFEKEFTARVDVRDDCNFSVLYYILYFHIRFFRECGYD